MKRDSKSVRGVVFLLLGVAGCGRAAPAAAPPRTPFAAARTGAGARRAAERAPHVVAQADALGRAAELARGQGDGRGAEILSERALVVLRRAFDLARLADATRERDEALELGRHAASELRELVAAREAADREANALERRVAVVRASFAPASPPTAGREASLLVATRALTTEAKLLCASARLQDAPREALSAAEAKVTAAEGSLTHTPAPLDAAARARAACLAVLTEFRRPTLELVTGQADALLSELSAAAWSPERDERGVLVVVREAFRGDVLSAEGQAKLGKLGQIAAAHPGVSVLVVLHDSDPNAPPRTSTARDPGLVQLAVDALVSAGAARSRTRGESAGGRIPRVDPTDVPRRSRNARLDVVFLVPVPVVPAPGSKS